MKLQSKNKVSADFNMSSMTDIIFLLLIFFVLTSNPSVQKALDLKLPSSDNNNNTQEPISVSITKDGLFYLDETNIPKESLEGALKNQLVGVARCLSNCLCFKT
ncbi:MAG: biopolymer transporter ExbD [Flavobacteriaceae bacterium]|nr:MAG: biopolymer transporter ExbD [Flavobacteriaceae bacterium]